MVSFAFLEDYCRHGLAEQWSVGEKQQLMVQYLEAFKEKRYSPDHLERIMQVCLYRCVCVCMCVP
jgi:hypothetical protein